MFFSLKDFWICVDNESPFFGFFFVFFLFFFCLFFVFFFCFFFGFFVSFFCFLKIFSLYNKLPSKRKEREKKEKRTTGKIGIILFLFLDKNKILFLLKLEFVSEILFFFFTSKKSLDAMKMNSFAIPHYLLKSINLSLFFRKKKAIRQ